MYFLVYLTVLCIIYVNAFKDNFTEEHIDKVTPVLAIICGFTVLLSVLSSTI